MSERAIRFRVWDGARMWTPDEAEMAFSLSPTGAVLRDVGQHEEAWMPCENAIVLQFTGLHDAEGREVYEGDILEYTHGPAKDWGVVGFMEHAFWMQGADGRMHMPRQDLRRVIGNIYENPALIT